MTKKPKQRLLIGDKPKILRVGFVVGDRIEGWSFDCGGGGITLDVRADGEPEFCGYTKCELQEISKEFWGLSE